MKKTYLWQCSEIVTHKKRWVEGVLVQTPLFIKPRKTILGHFFSVIASFFMQPLTHREICVQVGAEEHDVKTDAHGAFRIELSRNNRETCCFFYKNKPIIHAHKTEERLLKEPKDGSINVISDVDDTAILSHSANGFKRIFTLLLKRPKNRVSVPFTTSFLQEIEKNEGQVFYVSRSETNLYGLLSRTMANLKLPNGPLLLTPFATLPDLFKSGRKADFKTTQISRVLKATPEKKYALIGDDSQYDLAIYAQINTAFPGQICGIFIHQTQRKPKVKIQKMLDELRQSGFPVCYFTAAESGIHNAKKVIENG